MKMKKLYKKKLTLKPLTMKISILFISIFISFEAFGQSPIYNSNDSTKMDKNLFKLPPPAYDVLDTGTVIINVWIDKDGHVISSMADLLNSTTMNENLLKSSLKASKEARLTTIDVDTLRSGTIKYTYRRMEHNDD
jgi:hypothetical protein